MKLLVLCERVDAEGGTETYLRALLPALRARGYDVLVVARSVGTSGAYGVPDLQLPWSDEHDPPSAEARERLEAVATSFAPDVIAAHNVMDAGVVQAARDFGRRFVYHLHDHRPFCPNGDRLYPRNESICTLRMGTTTCGWHSLADGCAYGPRPRTFGLIALREALAAGVRAADVVVTFSEFVACLARDNGATRIIAIAPPLADDAFAQTPSPGTASGAVLFAGRIVPSKGGRSLVRALSRIASDRRPVLNVAGSGPDLQALLALAATLGVGVIALGRLDARHLRNAIDASALVAVPSLWAEPFGLAGIEAFARGRPVVGYDSGAIGEWLVPDAGAVVPRGDEKALAAAIVRYGDTNIWARACARALAASQGYRLQPHVDAIDALYRAA
ncbi:MAG TPA: glycosyltransferase family 4 protein [Candidatus Tumulicola sp.]